MITNEVKREVSLVNIQGQKSMSMKTTSKSFSLLIDKLYVDKPGAVVREIGSNARDAMVMAGKADMPFSIHIPNQISSELVFEDNGVGMDREEAEKYLNTLFESNKENSNDAIGAYGLGSKSPFSVTDNFIVETRKNGLKHIFNFFRDGSNTPQLLHIATTEWDGENGVTFRIPSSPSMYDTYKKSIAAQMFFFDPKPEISGLYDHSGLWDDYGSILFSGERYSLIESRGLRERYGLFIAVMGGVAYPIDINSVFRYVNHTWDDQTLNLKKASQTLLQQQIVDLVKGIGPESCIAIECDIGDISVPPSRELLEYDLRTFDCLFKKLSSLSSQFPKDFVNYLTGKMPVGEVKDFVEFSRQVSQMRDVYDWHRQREYGNGQISAVAKLLTEYKWYHTYDSVFGNVPTFDLNGNMMEYKLEIDISDPTSIDRKKLASMPFSVTKKMELSSRIFVCDEQGEIIPESTFDPFFATMTNDTAPPQSERIEALKNAGWVFVEGKHGPVVKVDSGEEGVAFTRSFSLEREVSIIEPIYRMATNTKPEYDKVIPANPAWVDWRSYKLDRIRIGSNRNEIWLLLDKDVNIGRTVSWFLRELVAKTRYSTDNPTYAQVMRCNPRDCNADVVLVRSRDHHFKHIEAMVAHFASSLVSVPTLQYISTIEIKKAPTQSSMGNVNLRGIRILKVDGNEGNNPQFQAISATGHSDLKPGFLIYSDGEHSAMYADREMRHGIAIKSLISLAKYMRMTKACGDGKEVVFYLLTPSRHKDTEKLVDIGCIYLGDILKNKVGRQMGYNIRPQFKRRLVHFIKRVEMSNALQKCVKKPYRALSLDDFKGGTIEYLRNNAADSKYGKLAVRAIAMHMKSGHYGWVCDDELKKIDEIEMHKFVYQYRKFYGHITVSEAICSWAVESNKREWVNTVRRSVRKWLQRIGSDAVQLNLKEAYLTIGHNSPLFETVKQEVAKRL